MGLHDIESEVQAVLVLSYCQAGLVPESKGEFAKFLETLKTLKPPNAIEYLGGQPVDHRIQESWQLAKELPGRAKPKNRQDLLTLCDYCLILSDYLVHLEQGGEALQVLDVAMFYLRNSFKTEASQLSPSFAQFNGRLQRIRRSAEQAQSRGNM